MIKKLLVVTTILVTMSLPVSAGKFFQTSIGPLWPQDLLRTNNPTAWNISLATGGIVDQKVGFGVNLDFMWNRVISETRIAENVYQINKEDKTFMFPISGFLVITPAPSQIVSPSFWGQLGLNTMYYSQTNDSVTNVQTYSTNRNGFYMGVIWKLGADAQFKIGENSSLFAGCLYQYSEPTHVGNMGRRIAIRKDMSALCIRAGIRASY